VSQLASVAGEIGRRRRPRRRVSIQPVDLSFVGVAALLFVASAAGTVAWCASMSGMEEMPMPGGWSLSMIWMPIPGQSWPGVAASFVAMWTVMMTAMMLPSVAPTLWRYRRERESGAAGRLAQLTALLAAGYLLVWAVLGLVVFCLGVVLVAAAMKSDALARAVPIMADAIIIIAGLLQFTEWKARHLARCRVSPPRDRSTARARIAWRQGVQLGVQCGISCAGPMAMLLVGGVMNLKTMLVVTVAITTERLTPYGERVARFTGVVAIAAGLLR
jgi:Predicted metal-binding integral membrane protein